MEGSAGVAKKTSTNFYPSITSKVVVENMSIALKELFILGPKEIIIQKMFCKFIALIAIWENILTKASVLTKAIRKFLDSFC